MPLFISCRHAAQGENIQKTNLRLSEILLNSYLFAPDFFFAIPLLCIGTEINHWRPRRINMISVGRRRAHRFTQTQHIIE